MKQHRNTGIVLSQAPERLAAVIQAFAGAGKFALASVCGQEPPEERAAALRGSPPEYRERKPK
jgi:hypothetical protein